MAGATKQVVIPTKWKTFHLTVTDTAQEITSDIIDNASVMIQSVLGNTGFIYFGNTATIGTTGNNAGGELQPGMSSVLPLSLSEESRLYVIGSIASQKLLVSIFNEGDVS